MSGVPWHVGGSESRDHKNWVFNEKTISLSTEQPTGRPLHPIRSLLQLLLWSFANTKWICPFRLKIFYEKIFLIGKEAKSKICQRSENLTWKDGAPCRFISATRFVAAPFLWNVCQACIKSKEDCIELIRRKNKFSPSRKKQFKIIVQAAKTKLFIITVVSI